MGGPDEEGDIFRLYLDECIVSRRLRVYLASVPQIDFKTPWDLDLYSASDPEVFDKTMEEKRWILTSNPRDFRPLIKIDPRHPGILCANDQQAFLHETCGQLLECLWLKHQYLLNESCVDLDSLLWILDAEC